MITKIKLNNKGFQQLRTLPAMHDLVMRAAERVASAAGGGFEAQASPSTNRARAVVVPTTAEAGIESAQNPAHLIGALDAARHV